jgi:hypothetical protein
MITNITFNKTGNFWIDNGIIGLYKVLQKLQEKVIFDSEGSQVLFDAILKPSFLEVSVEQNLNTDTEECHPDLILILNQARERLTQEYTSVSDKKYRWYFDEKREAFHLFQKTSYKNHLRGTFFNAKPEYEGTLHLPGTLEKEVIDKSPKKKNMDEAIFSKFEAFQRENNDIFQKNIDAKERNEGFLNEPTKYTFGDIFEYSFLEKGKNTCAFSGIKCKEIIDVNGMYSPVMTGSAGEMNFASFLGKKPQLSKLYAFVSLFSPIVLQYYLNDDNKNYFIFYDNNLKELNSFYDTITPDFSVLKNPAYQNFETHLIGTEYENETMFSFLVSVYKQAKQKLGKDKRKEIYTKSVFTFSNDGNIFRDVKQYTSLAQLFELFDAFDNVEDEKFSFDTFLNMFRFFTKTYQSGGKTKYDTTWRNRLCSDILSFRSIAKTTEWFIGEVRLKEETPQPIPYLDKIFQVYNVQTQFNMKPEMVEMCKSIGNRIGRYCREKDDKGILFSLRNAKNRSEFLNVLAESQFRTEVSYGEDFFKALPDSPQWEEYKALVSIFAMNSFLYRPESK